MAATNPNRPAATSRSTPTPAVATPNPPATTSPIAAPAPVPAPTPATTMRSPSTLSLLRGSSLSSSPSTSTDNLGLSIQEDFNPLTHSQNAAAIIAMHSNNVTPPLRQPSLATTDDMSSTVSITATTTSNESSTVAISMTQTQDVSDAASTTTNTSNQSQVLLSHDPMGTNNTTSSHKTASTAMTSNMNQSKVLLSRRDTTDDCKGLPVSSEDVLPELTGEDLKEAYDPDWICQECMASATTDPHGKKFERYIADKAKLVRTQTKSKSQTWTVCEDVKNRPEQKEFFKSVGIKGFDFSNLTECKDGKNKRINFLHLLQHLWPGDWREQLRQLNDKIEKKQQVNKGSFFGGRKKVIRLITENEFWTFFGLMLVARLEGKPGQTLWTQSQKKSEGYANRNFNMSAYMKLHRCNELKLHLPYKWADEGLKGSDDWWRIVRVFDWFAENHRRTVQTSNTKLVHKTMFAFRPQTHKDGNLPHLSYVQRKLENLGVEVKSCAALRPRVFLSLDIQRSKDDLNGREFLEEARQRKCQRAPCVFSTRPAKEASMTMIQLPLKNLQLVLSLMLMPVGILSSATRGLDLSPQRTAC